MTPESTLGLGKAPGELAERIRNLALGRPGPAEERLRPSQSTFWAGLRDLGTKLWLDTGDAAAAAELWTAEYSALTTNNTLLNAEVQKGIYDELIGQASVALGELLPEQRVVEIAFLLNARHGLLLARRFGGKVSVELHTALAHDVERTVAYGARLFAVCPAHFVIKVPYTAAGLVAARALGERGIPVNLTLGFSARQNYLAATFSKPRYVNIFVGRLGAYVQGAGWGDGAGLGEKVTLASHHAMREASASLPHPVEQIAASLRDGAQVRALAGVDVLTMPPKVAREAAAAQGEPWRSALAAEYKVELSSLEDVSSARVSTLWEVPDAFRVMCVELNTTAPRTADALVTRVRELGAEDVLPRFSAEDLELLDRDGKIPQHDRWADRIARGEAGIDTLLTMAGLLAFTRDQEALDDRVRRGIGK